MDCSTMDYDVLVLGSGFGGSVTALRLTEKGYRVGVLEAGRRFADDEFAKTSWRVRKYLWAPKFGCFGIQRLTLLKNTFVMSGTGVGGGSLVYANTLYEPPESFYRDPQWAHITDWRDELAPHYDQAKRMLGVTENPLTTGADEVLKEVADEMGIGHTYRRTPVGVFFGDAEGERVPDPFFGGAGPERRACRHCGECMTGCRHGAKNTLVKNYLYLAERAGAVVHPLTTVTSGMLATVLVDAEPGRKRWVLGLRELVRNRRHLPRILSPRRFSERMVGLLVMQTLDNSVTTYTRRGFFGRRMTTKQGVGAPSPDWIPAGHEVARRVAEKIDGIPQGAWTDLVNIPITGHFIGGCAIGDGPATGVLDPYQRLYGHPGLHVVDGSAISANLGVNPSLTITAQAERAMSFWPNKGDADARPPLGGEYRRVRPVAPKNPVVPDAAPGALRLPITPV